MRRATIPLAIALTALLPSPLVAAAGRPIASPWARRPTILEAEPPPPGARLPLFPALALSELALALVAETGRALSRPEMAFDGAEDGGAGGTAAVIRRRETAGGKAPPAVVSRAALPGAPRG